MRKVYRQSRHLCIINRLIQQQADQTLDIIIITGLHIIWLDRQTNTLMFHTVVFDIAADTELDRH